MAHTPGPWNVQSFKVSRWGRAGYIVADAKMVGYAYNDKTKMQVGEADANARLLAAAPDLLNELRRTREWVAQYLELPGHADAARFKVNAIDAAIAKAEGK